MFSPPSTLPCDLTPNIDRFRRSSRSANSKDNCTSRSLSHAVPRDLQLYRSGLNEAVLQLGQILPSLPFPWVSSLFHLSRPALPTLKTNPFASCIMPQPQKWTPEIWTQRQEKATASTPPTHRRTPAHTASFSEPCRPLLGQQRTRAQRALSTL